MGWMNGMGWDEMGWNGMDGWMDGWMNEWIDGVKVHSRDQMIPRLKKKISLLIGY